MSEPSDNQERSEYLATRSDYDKQQLEVSGRFDNWVMTIAGGALALSLTFLKDVAQPTARCNWLLVSAWALLCGSLLAGLWSQITSITAIEKYRDKMDNAYTNGDWTKTGSTGWADATRCLNWAATVMCMLGVLTLCVFSGLNMK